MVVGKYHLEIKLLCWFLLKSPLYDYYKRHDSENKKFEFSTKGLKIEKIFVWYQSMICTCQNTRNNTNNYIDLQKYMSLEKKE